MQVKPGVGLVLVVDDEPMLKELARQVLRRFGFTVLTAGGGDEAIALYERHRDEVGVVLLDMVMPHMTGKTVFHRIREMNPNAKIIISSGFSRDHDAEELLNCGAVAYVQKPYRLTELVDIINEVMGKA